MPAHPDLLLAVARFFEASAPSGYLDRVWLAVDWVLGGLASRALKGLHRSEAIAPSAMAVLLGRLRRWCLAGLRWFESGRWNLFRVVCLKVSAGPMHTGVGGSC